MTAGELNTIVASYFEKTSSDLIVNGVNLGYRALNNARKLIERQRDWFNQQTVAQLLVDPDNGALLANACVYLDDEVGVNVKSVETFYLQDESQTPNVLVPLYHHGKQTVMVKAKKRLGRRYMDDTLRYRSDDAGLLSVSRTARTQVFLHAGTVFLNPKPSEAATVVFDCQAWMDDYDADSDTDWMMEAAPDYFQWKAILELNNLWGQFVMNQEGNVPPPKDLMNEALASLIEWDVQLYEAGRQPRATNA